MSKVDLSGFNPKVNFVRGRGKLVETMWYLTKVFFFLSAIPYPNIFKTQLLRIFGAKIGTGLIIKPRVNIHFPWKLEIGSNVWLGEEVNLLNFELLKIGDNVCISQRVFICGGNHDYISVNMKYRNGPVTLGSGCWIGANSFIAPNVYVGIDTVVTACSFVVGSLNENAVYSGNPAKFIKPRWK